MTPITAFGPLHDLALFLCWLLFGLALVPLAGSLFWATANRFLRNDLEQPVGGSGTTVILVHGTWAPKASWIQSNSPLCRTLATSIGRNPASWNTPISFEAFSWSGQNTHAARELASKRLAARIAALKSQCPERNVIVLGHSHGGNVALASTSNARTGHCPDAVIALATPFPVVANRAAGQEFEIALAFGFAVFACLTVHMGLDANNIPAGWTEMAGLGVAFSILGGWVTSNDSKARRALIEEIQSSSRGLPDRTLIVRVADDEASSLLGMASFVVSGITGFAHLLAAQVGVMTNRMRAISSRHSVVLKVSIATGVLLAVVVSAVLFYFYALPPQAQTSASMASIALVATAIYFLVGVSLVSPDAIEVIGTFVLGVFIAAVAPFLLLGGMVFGWDMARHCLTVRISAEPCPTGTWRITLLPRRPVPKGALATSVLNDYQALSHSDAYEAPDALSCIGEWLATYRVVDSGA